MTRATRPMLLGVDLGTTATKAVLCGATGAIVAAASRPATLHSPAAGFAEADAAEWWRNVVSLVPELLQRAGASGSDIAAVSSSGMVPAVVCLGSRGPLRPAILQNDARAGREIDELAERLRDVDLLSLTGSPLSQQSVAPTLAWVARHEPEVWAELSGVAGSSDWLGRQLGAEPFTEYNWALESGMFQLDGSVLGAVLDATGIPPGWLAPVRRTGEVVGAVSADAGSETGLEPGTPIVVGGADHVLSAASAGLHRPGDALVKLGGAGDILVVADRAVIDRRLYLDAHPSPGLWLPNGCMATSGSLVRWLQRIVGQDDLALLDGEAAARAPAEILCLPYFLGEKSPIHDPSLRGAFVGLHLGHDRASLHRSVLEAVAFGFRHHVEILAEAGAPAACFRVTNGGSGSNLWKQIVADVLGMPVEPVVGHPGAAYGAALAAGVGVGVMAGWEEAGRSLPAGEPIRPCARSAATYDRAYRTWRELGAAMVPIAHAVAGGFA